MKYTLKLTMSGEFPGSPDHDYVNDLTDIEAGNLIALFRGRWRDTPEDC